MRLNARVGGTVFLPGRISPSVNKTLRRSDCRTYHAPSGIRSERLNKPSMFLAGPLSAVLFLVGVGGLGLLVPGCRHVHQTVSEIGELGSPAQMPLTILLCGVAGCMVVFACAIYAAACEARHSAGPAYFVGCMAISTLGVGLFAFPHPLHNVFGISELIGYQAPAALALSWRGDARARPLVILSWIMFALVGGDPRQSELNIPHFRAVALHQARQRHSAAILIRCLVRVVRDRGCFAVSRPAAPKRFLSRPYQSVYGSGP
jgi:hypothetical protein